MNEKILEVLKKMGELDDTRVTLGLDLVSELESQGIIEPGEVECDTDHYTVKENLTLILQRLP